MIFSSIGKNSVMLGAFALVATALLALTAELTKGRIANSEREAQEKALLDVVPRQSQDANLLTETMKVPPEAWAGLGLKAGGDIFVVRRADDAIAVIIPAVAPDGYSGEVKMIVGVDAEGEITGVRILDHHETPGLGDKIDIKKTPWILSFTGKSLANPSAPHWKVKKDGGDFDQFAGATITPRAVVNQVRKVLEFVESHKNELFQKKTNEPSKRSETH